MRVAVVSDLHGNLTAFEAVLADVRQCSPALVLHGGDLADRLGDSMESTEIIQTIDAEIARLEKARALLSGHTPSPKRERPVSSKLAPKSQRRKMSAAGRARMAAAQKARWAKAKA